MAFEDVKKYFKDKGLEDRVMSLKQSSATVEEAAAAIGCKPEEIAKTLSFLIDNKAILIVTAGDARVDNKKYKACFGTKAKMIPHDMVEELTGHAPGGVCPFMVCQGVEVFLDESLKRFERVYPAAGNDHSAVDLSLEELSSLLPLSDWVNVCKDWE